MSFFENRRQVGVDLLKDRINHRSAIQLNLAVSFQVQEVGMMKRLDCAPAREDLLFIEVALDEAHDDMLTVFVGSGEERAAAFRQQQLVKGKGAVNGYAFIFGP